MTKNRTPTPVYLDPGMHSGLEVKGLMAMVHIMRTSVGKIYSGERFQRLCKKLYHTVLNCQNEITVLQPMCVLDAMYAVRR